MAPFAIVERLYIFKECSLCLLKCVVSGSIDFFAESIVFLFTSRWNIIVNGTLQDFEKKYHNYLLRIHAGYIINPNCVTKIERFAVYLSDGTKLPVPEKKYTAIKQHILSDNLFL